MIYNYTKTVNLDRFKKEIQASLITIVLDSLSLTGSDLTVKFKADLSTDEQTTLSSLVTAHVNTPLPAEINRVEVISIPPIASKTLANGKKVYERVVGIQSAVTIATAEVPFSTIDWTVPYPHAKMIGVAIVNATSLDTVDFEVYDTAAGTYSQLLTGTAVPNAKLNQFGFTTNISKDYYEHKANFDADIYQGMIIRMKYRSSTAKTVGINFIMNEVKAT